MAAAPTSITPLPAHLHILRRKFRVASRVIESVSDLSNSFSDSLIDFISCSEAVNDVTNSVNFLECSVKADDNISQSD
jgi:hypothetical protein